MPGYQVPLTTVDANTTINNQKLVTTGNDVGKNYLINGDFSIWQRGTSFTGPGHVADRWHIHDGSASVVIAKTTDGISLSGTTAAFAAGNTFNGLEYRGIESQDIYGALVSGPMTFSWKMKSTVNTTIGLRLDLFDSSGTRHSYTPLISVSQSSTFIKYSVTIPQNSIITKRNTEQGFQPQFVFVETRSIYLGGSATSWNSPATLLVPQAINAFSGGNATFEIAEVQLEKGSIATPFGRRPIGQELALCQRYYNTSIAEGYTATNFPIMGTTGAGGIIFTCSQGSTNDIFGNIQYPVAMRSTPSISIYSGNNRTSGAIRDMVTGSDLTPSNVGPQSGQNKNFTYISGLTATANRHYGFHYIASAEF